MRTLILQVSFFLTTISTCIAQTYINHGMGIHVGFLSENSISTDYELSILTDDQYIKGILTGVGASFSLQGLKSVSAISDLRRYALYARAGYRLSNLSLGLYPGIRSDDVMLSHGGISTQSNFILGTFIGINVIRTLKIAGSIDPFNGLRVGVIYLPNTITNNRRK